MDRRKSEALRPKRYAVRIIITDSPAEGEAHFTESELADLFCRIDLPAGLEADHPSIDQLPALGMP